MMRSLFLLLLFTTTAFSTQANDGYVLKGTIHGNYTGYIYLSYQKHKDSTRVHNNTFEFQGSVAKPERAWLNLQPTASVAWIQLENSSITVEGDFRIDVSEAGPINVFTISSIQGSYSQKLIDEYRAFCNANRSKDNFDALRFQELKIMFTKNRTHPITGWILSDLVANNPIYTQKEFKELYALIDSTSMHSSDIAELKRGLSAMNRYGAGQPFFSFTLPNLYGENITLAKYSGKIVLIDFWASWCGPCRAKHPELVALQKKYQNNKFNVVGISIDTDKLAWRNAITKDGLLWDNLLDAEHNTLNELGIQGIPYNYLLDENGIILAVNPSLEKINLILEEKFK